MAEKKRAQKRANTAGGPMTAPCWRCTGCGAKKMAPRRYNPPPRRPYYYRRPMR